MEQMMKSEQPRRLKAAQVRGTPEFPVQNLYPCALGPEPFVAWLLGELQLAEGILFRSDGRVSYAPVMVPRMTIRRLSVVVQIDAFDEECVYGLRLLYTSNSGEHFEQRSQPIRAVDTNSFAFDVPLEHVGSHSWFTCALYADLLTAMPHGPERAAALAAGCEEPHMPVLLRGVYLEIKG